MSDTRGHSVRVRLFVAFVLFVLLAVVVFVATPFGQGWLAAQIEGLNTPERPKAAGDILTTGKKVYSQFREELIIRDFFQDREGGVFVDVGCAWPDVNSTTCYLDLQLNWTGIAVDAVESYRSAWELKRPHTKFFAYAVTDHAGDRLKFFEAPNPTVSSLNKERVESWRQEPKEIEVETITLNKLLEDNGVDHIDFLSMDIEGAEPKALAGFDIDRFKPSLICIEANWTEEEKRVVEDYFAGHGYERIKKYEAYDLVNWYLAPAKSPS